MPTVIFACTSTPATERYLVETYHQVALKPGETFESRFDQKDKKRRCLPHFLVKTGHLDKDAGVICYAYGGTEKIARKDEKRYIPAEEAAFINKHHPGLIEIVAEDGGPDDVTPVLFEKVKDSERARDVAIAEAEQAKNALLSMSTKANNAEQSAGKHAIESAAKDQTIADLQSKLAAAQALLEQKKAVDDAPANKKK